MLIFLLLLDIKKICFSIPIGDLSTYLDLHLLGILVYHEIYNVMYTRFEQEFTLIQE